MANEVEIRPLFYNTVAAGQTAQTLIGRTQDQGGPSGGAKGARNDVVEYITVVPATTSPGAIALLDSTTSISVFAGGAGSVGDLKPFTIMLGARSLNGAWKLTTGTNVSAIAFGHFT